jgi:hypothetical protein
MGVIPSLFMSYMPEAHAFISFLQLMVGRKRSAHDYFDPAGMTTIGLAWERLLKRRLGEVKRVLDLHRIETAEYLPPWLQTAFLTRPIDPRIRLRVFDRFVAFGTRALFSFGLVIMFGVKHIMFSADRETLLKKLMAPESDPLFRSWKRTIDQLDRFNVTSIEFKRLMNNGEDVVEEEESSREDD